MLSSLRRMFEVVDPMPADLPERIRFTLALRDLEAEVARFASEPDEVAFAAARGAEESRTITFDSDSLTIMIRVEANADGTVRVDGWLAPARPGLVEMQMASTSITATADKLGRFAFHSVPRGTARLVAHAAGGDGPAGPGQLPSSGEKSVITPALVLLGGE
jgi:hypothetical protein